MEASLKTKCDYLYKKYFKLYIKLNKINGLTTMDQKFLKFIYKITSPLFLIFKIIIYLPALYLITMYFQKFKLEIFIILIGASIFYFLNNGIIKTTSNFVYFISLTCYIISFWVIHPFKTILIIINILLYVPYVVLINQLKKRT